MSEAERLAERLRELLAKAHLPWRVQKETLPNRVGVTAANHEFITWAMGSGWKADLIVEAVNALPTLLARIDALENALLAIEAMETYWALGIDGGMENARR